MLSHETSDRIQWGLWGLALSAAIGFAAYVLVGNWLVAVAVFLWTVRFCRKHYNQQTRLYNRMLAANAHLIQDDAAPSGDQEAP